MKKTSLVIFAFSVILILSQCAKKNAPAKSKSQTPAEEAAAMKSKYTPAQMAQGKVISDTKCAECHDLHQPGEFTISEWNDILPKMSQKAKLSSNDAGLLRSWVITNAKAG